MSPVSAIATDARALEIAALIETMSTAEKRLEELTAGQVDAVLDQAGQAYVLQHAQQRLRDQEAVKQAAILDVLPASIALIDARGAIISVNTAWCRFAACNDGLGPGHALGANYLDVCEQAVGDEAASAHRIAAGLRAVLTGASDKFTDEYACHSPTEERWFEMTASPLSDTPPSGAVVMHRDISERKRAEKAILRLGLLLRAVASGTPDTVFVKDVEGRYLLCNEAFAAFVGRSVEQMIGQDYASLFGGKFAIENAETDRRVMETGLPLMAEEELDGVHGTATYLVTKAPYRDETGRVLGVIGVSRDITLRKNAERQTKLLAYRLTNILESITDGFFTLDKSWRYTFVNNEALRMLGRTREELIGAVMWEVFPQAVGTAFDRGYRAAMDSNKGSSFEAFYAPWAAWIGVHCYPSETGLSVSFRDITQRKHDEVALRELATDLEARVASRTAELTQAREEAELANRAKSSFLAAMSHEIRTPMNGVIGMIDVLEQTQLKSAQADIVRTVRESAYALLGIVDDVLDFSKIEAGHFPIDQDPMSIQKVLSRACDTLNYLADNKNVTLRHTVDPRIPGVVLGDAARLRQVLLNLIGNAVKFSSSTAEVGKVKVAARWLDTPEDPAAEAADGAEAAEAEPPCLVEFSITDNGIGMDGDTLGRLFMPFSQADGSTTRRFGGTGLGLSISSRLAGLMGGNITVTSVLGRGSRFVMRIPFRRVPAGTCEETAHTLIAELESELYPDHDGETLPMPLGMGQVGEASRLILVAEDNEINQKVIRKQLGLLGFVSHIAADGRQALDRARHGSYALLLTDLHMPVMDGYELAAAVRREEGIGMRMPIVALTANALKGEAKRCRDVGMDDYMTKPLQLADLHAMLTRWMPPNARPSLLREPRAAGPSPRTGFDALLAPAVPAVDLTVLTALVGHDPAVVVDLLTAFVKSAATSSDAIRKGMALGSLKSIANAAHTLKSGARSIGAKRLGNICDEIETAADAGRGNELAAQIPRFDQALADVHRFLEER